MDWVIDVHELPSYRFGIEEGLQQGVQEGLQQGLQKGLQQGLQQGELSGERRALKRLLSRRFGELPDWAERRIDEVASIEALDDLIDRAATADSLAELFGQEA